MEKIVKRVGNSIGITFSGDDKKIWDLRPGKVVQIEIKEIWDLKKGRKHEK